MVIRPPPPESDRVDYSFNLHSQSMRYDDRQQESPYQPDSSDGSFDDSCDLDDITPVRQINVISGPQESQGEIVHKI